MDALDSVKYTGKDTANKGLRPNNIFANAVYSLVKGSPLVWKDPKYAGRNWANYTWDTLSWANFTWDNFTWYSVAWNNFTWDAYLKLD